MILHFSDLIGTPLLDFGTGALLGLIKDIIIRPEDGKIEGFWVKSVEHPWKNHILQTQDILEWKKNVYLRGPDSISLPHEVVRMTAILEKKTYVIDNRVYTEEGRSLGRVYDLDFSTDEFILRNIYVAKRFLWGRYEGRIIGRDDIIEILPDHITVRDLEIKKSLAPTLENTILESESSP